MARDPKQLRKAYEYKLGKDLVAKLSDEQIAKLSKYYNSLSPAEQSKVDSELIQGQGEFLDSARSMARKKEVTVDSEPKPTTPKVQSRKKVPIEKGEKTSNKKPSALVIYKPDTKKSEDVIANEDIDPSILSALGLDDGVDIDYDTYKTLLREKMAAGRMTDTKMSSSETKMFTDEYKRTKGKTGKFVVNTNKTNVNKIINSGKALTGGVRGGALVRRDASKQEDNKEQIEDAVTETIPDSFIKVSAALDSINQILARQLNLDKKEADTEKSEAEQAKRESKEKGAEKGRIKSVVTGVANVVKKAPFFDTIMNYLKNIALGSAVLAFMKWLENPENQEKLENFGNFIVDNLPIIFGGLAAILALNIGAKLLSFLGLLKGIAIGLGPLLLKLGAVVAIAAAPFVAAIAVQDEGEKAILRNYESTYGKEDAETGIFITKLRDQYGRMASQGDRDRLLSDEDKEIANYLEIADEALKKRQKLREEEKRIQDYIDAGEVTDARTKRLEELEELIGQENQKIDGILGQLEIDGKSMDELKRDFRENLVLPQTDLSKELYPKSGVGEEMSGVPLHYGQGEDTPEEGTGLLQGRTNPFERFLKETAGTTRSPVSSDANYDVIIPLDHAKKAGSVADDPSGTSFGQSNSTGADGREREHQDRAAQKLKSELEKQGIRVKIVTPEEHGNYQDYDKFIRSQSEKGVRVVPLHFDAITEGGGVGFLTRTRAGDQADAEFAAPIQQALADFQKKNPDLGNLGQDTMGNATVNQGAASPTALIELGEMVRWEQKHGKNFTDSPEFMELIRGVAGGIGQNFGDAPTPAQLSPDQDMTEPPPPPAQRVSFIPLDGTQPGASPVIASSHASQDTPSVFSPSDPNDSSSLLNRSIYNAPVV